MFYSILLYRSTFIDCILTFFFFLFLCHELNSIFNWLNYILYCCSSIDCIKKRFPLHIIRINSIQLHIFCYSTSINFIFSCFLVSVIYSIKFSNFPVFFFLFFHLFFLYFFFLLYFFFFLYLLFFFWIDRIIFNLIKAFYHRLLFKSTIFFFFVFHINAVLFLLTFSII